MQIELVDLTIGYNTQVVKHNLRVIAHAGEMICLLGPNGCGKSTLLRTICGLQPQLGGDLLINHIPLHNLSDKEKAKQIALVLTERLSIENTSVHDVVALGRHPYSSFLGSLSAEDETIITTALHQVGMEQKSQHFFNCLSDGEKQRTLIAKALAQQTPIILLDEPTAHLDLPNRIRILLLLRQLAHEQNKCVIISTHELDLALQTADTIWLMSSPTQTNTTALQVGTPHNLIASGAFTQAFTNEHFHFENNEGQLRIVLNQ